MQRIGQISKTKIDQLFLPSLCFAGVVNPNATTRRRCYSEVRTGPQMLIAYFRKSEQAGFPVIHDVGIDRRRSSSDDTPTPALFLINLAAISPMITQGAIVLPVVTRGRIEPSAMRRLSMP